MGFDVMDVFVKIGADTSGLESGIDKAKGLAGGIGGAISTGMKVAGAAIGAATTAAAGFAAASVKVGADFDTSMSQVAATMGVTVDEISGLRDYAQQMGSTTAFSATQAADALNYMALAGYDADKSMQMLPNVLNLAAAGSMDLAAASDMVTDAESALGLKTEDMEGFVDQLAKTASKSNTSVAQLGDAILTVGGTAKVLSGGTTELNTSLGILADNGIKGAEGGTKLRNVILSLSAPTDKAATMLETLGVSTVDAEGNLRPLESIMGELSKSLEGMGTADKADIINTIFNKQDIAAVNALLDTDVSRWNELSAAIDDSKGAADAMANTQLDNLAGDITLFQSALEGAQIAISDVLTGGSKDEGLRAFVNLGTEGISKVTEAFKSGGLTGAMEAFGSFLSDALNMIIAKLPEFINAGMQLLGALGQGIIDNLPTIVDAAVQIVVQLAQGLVEALPELVTGFITLIEALKTSLAENAEPLLDAGRQLLEYIWTGISENLPTFLESVYAALPDLISQITDFIRENGADFIGAGLDLMLNMIEGIMESFPDVIGSITDLLVEMVLTLTDPTNLAKFIIAAGDIIMALANGLLEAIPKLIDAIPQIISNLVAALVAALPEILAVGIQLLFALVTGIVQAIPRLVAAIPAIILALVGGLTKGIKSITKVGKDMIEGLWKGIKTRWDNMVRDLTNLAKNLIGSIKRLFGISSPSKVFAAIGENLDAGLAQGIMRNADLVSNAMGDLSDVISEPVMASTISVGGNGLNSSASVLAAMANEQNTNRNLTVILELEKSQLAKAVYKLNNEETQRVGLNLAGGFA